MNTHESYVSLETAKLLKEAGFDWECCKIYYCYHEDGDTWELGENYMNHQHILEVDYCLLAPTLAVVQRWLIEKYRILIEVQGRSCYEMEYEYIFTQPCYNATLWDAHSDELSYNTYEEALEAGVKKCLKLILEKDDN